MLAKHPRHKSFILSVKNPGFGEWPHRLPAVCPRGRLCVCVSLLWGGGGCCLKTGRVCLDSKIL